MPAEPVPLTGRVKCVRRGENLAEALVGGVENGQEVGVEVPQDRPRPGPRPPRDRDWRDPGPSAGGRKSAPAHRGRPVLACANAPPSIRPSGRLPAWNGFSLRTGSFPPSAPTSPRTRARTPTGCGAVRRGAPANSSARPDAEALHLVMVIAGGAATPETVQTLHALQQQTTPHWTLTVVVRNSWQTAFTALLERLGAPPDEPARPGRVRRGLGAAGPHARPRGWPPTPGPPSSLLFPGDIWAPDAVAQLAGRALAPDRRLRRRGLVTAAGRARRSPAQAVVLARIPPLVRLYREATRHRVGDRTRSWHRRAPACPTSNTIWPCGPARRRDRSSIFPRSCAIGSSRRGHGPSPGSPTSRTWSPPCCAGARRPR